MTASQRSKDVGPGVALILGLMAECGLGTAFMILGKGAAGVADGGLSGYPVRIILFGGIVSIGASTVSVIFREKIHQPWRKLLGLATAGLIGIVIAMGLSLFPSGDSIASGAGFLLVFGSAVPMVILCKALLSENSTRIH